MKDKLFSILSTIELPPNSNSTLLSFLLILIPVVVLILWKKQNKSSRTCSNQPPQPPKLPLIGNLHQIMCLLPHRRLTELAKIYGPLMQLRLGQVCSVVVSSPEVAKQLFKDNDINVSNRCRVSVSHILLYRGEDIAFAPYGEYWRQMRKLCILELLSSKRVKSFESIREQEVSNFIHSVNSKVGLPINLSEMVLSLSHSITSRTIIGRENKYKEGMFRIISRLMKTLGGFTVLDMFPSLGFIHAITGTKSRLLKLHKEVDQLLETIIKEQKAELRKGGQTEANNNLVKVLLSLQANDDSLLTTDGIKAITLEMFIAMIDTAAIVIEWVMSELIKNPSVMKKAQAEVRKVCAENGNKLDESVIHELKFFKAIIKETLRLHPPAPLVPRLLGEECKINGYNINANTDVLVNVWAIGRDANHWMEPEKFYPERFVDNDIDYNGCNFEFIPFGAGRRMCPGVKLGIANLELPLAKLLSHFDWKLPNQMKPENLDMSENFAVSIKRKTPLYLIPVASP